MNILKNIFFKAFGPKVFTRIPLEDIPDVKTWDPFSMPILESGIGSVRFKPYRNGIERVRKETLAENIANFEAWQSS